MTPRPRAPGKGRRAALLPGHEPKAAPIVRGLKGAPADQDVLTLLVLDPGDRRVVDSTVAGPAGLLIAKLHKVDQREGAAWGQRQGRP